MSRKIILFIVCFSVYLTALSVAYAQQPSESSDPLKTVIDPTTLIVNEDIGAVDIILEKDVFLVLDNSGSMKQSDPGFLTKQAVTEFITGLDESTRVGIIIFDQSVRLSAPLTRISLGNRGEILSSLEEINYRGLFTNSPDAIERAIYELRSNARDGAQKMIVFMTDGIVDTGDADKDVEKSRWLKDSLASDAADNDIKIFGIAFTEAADFELIQSLAQKTDGEYFRALQPEDLQRVFSDIETVINKPPEPVQVTVIQRPVDPTPQVIIEVPAQPQAIGNEERLRSIITIFAVVILVVVMLAILIIIIRKGRNAGQEMTEADTEAYLNDIHGFTDKASYKLSSRPTMIGRVAGKDSDHLDYLVIPESTIGRRHSLIEYKDFAYWIVDQGSINGTFVNDQPVTSEVRLKHGDKVRLHKCEFEFVMPEMVDAGMTVISNTVMVDAEVSPSPVSATEQETELTGSEDGGETSEDIGGLDFDITGTGNSADEVDDDDAPTEMRADLQGQSGADVPDIDESEDETVIRGGADEGDKPPAFNPDDETLMPGKSLFEDDDATIREELEDDDDEDISLDNFIDLDLDENDK